MSKCEVPSLLPLAQVTGPYSPWNILNFSRLSYSGSLVPKEAATGSARLKISKREKATGNAKIRTETLRPDLGPSTFLHMTENLIRSTGGIDYFRANQEDERLEHKPRIEPVGHFFDSSARLYNYLLEITLNEKAFFFYPNMVHKIEDRSGFSNLHNFKRP